MTNYFLTEIKGKTSFYLEADEFKMFSNLSPFLLSAFFTLKFLYVLYVDIPNSFSHMGTTWRNKGCGKTEL